MMLRILIGAAGYASVFRDDAATVVQPQSSGRLDLWECGTLMRAMTVVV